MLYGARQLEQNRKLEMDHKLTFLPGTSSASGPHHHPDLVDLYPTACSLCSLSRTSQLISHLTKKLMCERVKIQGL